MSPDATFLLQLLINGIVVGSIYALVATGFVIIYLMHYEFEDYWGAIYSAFAQNLVMSILFIAMLVRRDNVEGQSMYIALFKWLGMLE